MKLTVGGVNPPEGWTGSVSASGRSNVRNVFASCGVNVRQEVSSLDVNTFGTSDVQTVIVSLQNSHAETFQDASLRRRPSGG